MDTNASDAKKRALSGTQVVRLPVKNLRANPYNRTHLDETGMDVLARTIAKEGVKEPLLVRPTEEWEIYEIASGHRRWQAAQRAGLETLPCLVKNLSHQQVSEMNIVANIQRAGTPGLELAEMVSDYMLRFSRTPEQAAKSFGKSLAWISKLLKTIHKPGDRRRGGRRVTDPLAEQWADLMDGDQVAPRGSWKIRFAGDNRWELNYPVDPKNPSASLAAFLRKLADALDKK
jgi:ParB/RepB/Spo0J family partition protein